MFYIFITLFNFVIMSIYLSIYLFFFVDISYTTDSIIISLLFIVLYSNYEIPILLIPGSIDNIFINIYYKKNSKFSIKTSVYI